ESPTAGPRTGPLLGVACSPRNRLRAATKGEETNWSRREPNSVRVVCSFALPATSCELAKWARPACCSICSRCSAGPVFVSMPTRELTASAAEAAALVVAFRRDEAVPSEVELGRLEAQPASAAASPSGTSRLRRIQRRERTARTRFSEG